MLEDTIIAISTPPGMGGLGIVRLSGKKALAVARRIFRARKTGRGTFPVRRPVLGSVVDSARKEVIDEAFLTYFKAPRSYTLEDVVELSCHGSPVLLEEIVRLGVRSGARPAHPGEFTLRAFANGRLDILQAEAVNDLIRAASLTQARISIRQLSGGLSRRITRLRARLIHLSAQIEAGIEYPEETLKLSPDGQARTLSPLISELERLIASYQAGRFLIGGVAVAITGRTNVGKSTLFNALLGEDRAIVTSYPGTTRDYLREDIVIDELVFHVFDMAGLGKPAHAIEKKGILKGNKIARQADGLLIVLDGSRRATPEDEQLIRRFRAKKAILVVNKADLPVKIDRKWLRAISRDTPLIEVSALKRTHIEQLRREIRRTFGPAEDSWDDVILHSRQKDILVGILTSLEEARRLFASGHSEEFYAEELRKALALIGRLTGEVRAEEVINDIFGRFCVGK